MDLFDAEILAKQLISDYVPDYHFEWGNYKRFRGMCDYSRRTIYLSRHITPLRTEEAVRGTIMHEIAHALTPGAGHGRAWKLQMIKFGLSPDRCSKDQVDTSALAGWKIFCKFCGHSGTFIRKPRVARSCGKCSPRKYNEKYKMELVKL